MLKLDHQAAEGENTDRDRSLSTVLMSEGLRLDALMKLGSFRL